MESYALYGILPMCSCAMAVVPLIKVSQRGGKGEHADRGGRGDHNANGTASTMQPLARLSALVSRGREQKNDSSLTAAASGAPSAS